MVDEHASLGDRIRLLRESRGMSLGDLERACGVTKGYLSQLERGEASNPTVDAVRKIASGLEVPVAELIGAEEGMEDLPSRLPSGFSEFVTDAKTRGTKLTEDDIKMLLAIRYRGRSPRTANDWALLHDFIKRIVG